MVKLLDCTLRDGGYINDWKFGHSVITGTYKRLDAAGVDFIEVGFLDDRKNFDMDRTIQPNTKCYNKIFAGIQKRHAIPVAMIDYGTCDIANIDECNLSFIDGIRVIFKKEKIEQALPFCKIIKDKGYKLFIQAISITSYSDYDMLEYIRKINEIKPYAFSIVDTYGVLDSKKLIHYFNLLDNNLDSDIHIGYHSHNNFQLAFSNSITFLAQETKRTIITDSTVYGMGKSAGNCASELIMMHMNEKYGTNYKVDQVLEILDTDLMAVYQKHYWGYKYNFFISAMQNCHPNYVQFLLDKKTLSISAINEILSRIPQTIKLKYEKDYIENAYTLYQSHEIDDSEDIKQLGKEFMGREIVVLGPGRSMVSQMEEVKEFIHKADALVIAINIAPIELDCDYLFISNTKRYSKLTDLSDKRSNIKLILTSNITPYDEKPDFMLNYSTLLDNGKENNDNALLCFLAAMKRIGVKTVHLAGFDGFTANCSNYYDDKYNFAGNEEYNVLANKRTIEGLRKIKKIIRIVFITKSIYEEALV